MKSWPCYKPLWSDFFFIFYFKWNITNLPKCFLSVHAFIVADLFCILITSSRIITFIIIIYIIILLYVIVATVSRKSLCRLIVNSLHNIIYFNFLFPTTLRSYILDPDLYPLYLALKIKKKLGQGKLANYIFLQYTYIGIMHVNLCFAQLLV